MPKLRELKNKLFTLEDRFNFHKTLGIFCLLHYAFRFAQAGPTDMGFRISKQTLACIVAHYVIDAVALGAPLITSGNGFYLVSGLIVIGLALVPGVLGLIGRRNHGPHPVPVAGNG